MSFGPPFALNLLSPHHSQLLLNGAASALKVGNGAETTPSSSAPPGVLASPSDLGAAFPFPGPLGPGLPGAGPHPPPFGLPPFGFLPNFPPHELNGDRGGPGGLYGDGGFPGYPGFGGPLDLNGARRKNATRETTAALKAWLFEHRKNPYPTKGEKIMLAIITKMTLTQVSTWFANARRRLKKENKMTWSPRNRAGEEDEDLGDPMPGDDPSSPNTTASPSLTLLKDEDEEENNGTGEEKNNNSEEAGSEEAEAAGGPPPPKRPKIWSIADTVAEGAAAVAAAPRLPQPPPPGLVQPPSGPLHFTFNPWQQQAAALAGLLRPGFPGVPNPFLGPFRPDFRLPFPPPGPHLLAPMPSQPPPPPPEKKSEAVKSESSPEK